MARGAGGGSGGPRRSGSAGDAGSGGVLDAGSGRNGGGGSGSGGGGGSGGSGSGGSGGLGIALRIDAHSPVAPFEQLRAGIRDAIASGELAAGVRLPTVRALAAQLGLAVNTVARSYRELETDALIETRGRLGSFVATTGSPARQELQAAARAFADRAATLGIDPREALDLAAAALGLPPKPPAPARAGGGQRVAREPSIASRQ